MKKAFCAGMLSLLIGDACSMQLTSYKRQQIMDNYNEIAEQYNDVGVIKDIFCCNGFLINLPEIVRSSIRAAAGVPTLFRICSENLLDIVKSAARTNCLEILQCLVGRGISLGASEINAIAEEGNLEMAKQFFPLFPSVVLQNGVRVIKKAVDSDNLQLVKWLLSEKIGSNSDIFAYAITNEKWKIVKYLVKNTDIRHVNTDRNVLQLLTEKNRWELLQELFDRGAECSEDIVEIAVNNNCFESLKVFIGHESDVVNSTPIRRCIFLEKDQKKKSEILRLFMSRDRTESILSTAVIGRCEDIVKELLSLPSYDPNYVTEKDATDALEAAIYNERFDIIPILLADSRTNPNGMLGMLMSKKTSLDIKLAQAQMFLSNPRYDVNEPGRSGYELYFIALAYLAPSEIVQYVVEHGANPYVQLSTGENMIEWANRYCRPDLADLMANAWRKYQANK